jgi:hypothetical protein
MASQSIGVLETRVTEMAYDAKADRFMRTGAGESPSWPEQLLRGRIHCGRLFETIATSERGGRPMTTYAANPRSVLCLF